MLGRSSKQVRKKCKHCKKGTKNQKRFHGLGSFCRTHPFDDKYLTCCGSQDNPKCYSRGQERRHNGFPMKWKGFVTEIKKNNSKKKKRLNKRKG